MAKAKNTGSKKPPGTAINTRHGQRAQLTGAGRAFPIPSQISEPEAITAWEQYWEDPVSSIVTEADKQLLVRWVDMVDRYWKLIRKADREPTYMSSANGILPHPLYKVCFTLANQIERLETKLGIGPKARITLGIQIVAAEGAFRRQGEQQVPLVDEDDDDPRLA